MKRFETYLLMALMVLAGCTKMQLNEEAIPDQEVSFHIARSQTLTKAGGMKAAEEEFTTFTCKGFLHAEGVNLDESHAPSQALGYQDFFGSSTTTPAYTEAVSYTFSDANGNGTKENGEVSWNPAHAYYWPKSPYSYVNFVAWYGTGNGDNNHPVIGYGWDSASSKYKATLDWAFESAVNQGEVNLLYADPAWHQKSTTSAQYGAVSNVSRGVPLLFHHALAQINVRVITVKAGEEDPNITVVPGENKVTDGTATWTITLANPKITNIYTTGNLHLEALDSGTENSQGTWTGTGWTGTGSTGVIAPADFTVREVDFEGAGEMNLIAPTCVIPQTIGADVVLSFDMQIVTEYANDVRHQEIIGINIKLNDMGTNAWAQNTKYTYNIKINPSQNSVFFDPVVQSEWQTGSSEQTI